MTTGAENGYIRGAGGVHLGGWRVGRAVAYLIAFLLSGAALWAAISTASQNSRAAHLRSGAPVQVTVTGCAAVSSGIGMGVEYYQCRGSYTYAGRSYVEVIEGSRAKRETGDELGAVVDRTHPSVVSVVGGVRRSSYSLPIGLGAGAALLIGGLVLTRTRESRTALGPSNYAKS